MPKTLITEPKLNLKVVIKQIELDDARRVISSLSNDEKRKVLNGKTGKEKRRILSEILKTK